MPHRVNRQKYFLHRIVNVARILEASRCHRAQIRDDLFKECPVGNPIVILRIPFHLASWTHCLCASPNPARRSESSR
jgi:hypothetical protein